MSALIAAAVPKIAVPVVEGVAEAQAREQQFAANLAAARNSYRSTNGAGGQQILGTSDSAGTSSARAGVGLARGAGSSAAQADQLDQTLTMPMQMAGQAAQIPQEGMEMAASVPRGVSQGVQSATQQVGHISGVSGAGSADAGKHHGESIEGTPEQNSPAQSEQAAEDSTSAGGTGGERAPQPESSSQEAAVPPAQTRPVEPSPESVL